MNRTSDPQFAGESAVFIFGTGRSGTSWLGSIFDSHPCTYYLHEPDAVCFDARVPYVPAEDAVRDPGMEVVAFGEKLLGVRALRAVQKSRHFRKSYRSNTAEAARRMLIRCLMLAERTIGPLLPVSRCQVPDWVRSQPFRPVVKSVDSVARLPLLARALPRARFLLVVRHPAGVVASMLRGLQLGEMPAPRIYDDQLKLPLARRRGLSRKLCEAMSESERIAWSWAIMNDFAIELAEALPNVRTLRYEDLCQEPLEVSRRLFEWTELGWPDQTERYIRLLCGTVDEVTDYHAVIRNPQGAVHRWKYELDEASTQGIAKIVTGTRPGALFGYA